MTEQQALTQARKRFGKTAAIECVARGGFIGQDGQWRDGLERCCEHGKRGDRHKIGLGPDVCDGKKRDFYVVSRSACEHCGNGIKYEFARVKYPVALYKVGKIMGVGGIRFFEVKAVAESWEACFRKTDAKNETAHAG